MQGGTESERWRWSGNQADTERVSRNDRRPAPERFKVMFERLAQVAERIAATAEYSARVHDQMVGHLPDAMDRAAGQRRLAAAEKAAAVAYRNLEVPPTTVRRAIVASGRQSRRTAPSPASPENWLASPEG
jgi:hypothetical protein